MGIVRTCMIQISYKAASCIYAMPECDCGELSPCQEQILTLLEESHPGGESVGTIADELGYVRPYVSSEASKLVEEGKLQRPDQGFYRLTEK